MARIPGWARPWTLLNTAWRMPPGTSGRCTPLEKSQSTSQSPQVTGRTSRDLDSFIAATSAQLACAVANSVAEKGRGGGSDTTATTGAEEGGRERASATMLFSPLMWRTSLVYSAM